MILKYVKSSIKILLSKMYLVFGKLKYSDTAQKVFCIGMNKTGTTSIEHFLIELGYKMAPQILSEKFISDWYNRDFDNIIQFAKKYNGFQDRPWNLPYIYVILDHYFPNSKFILTIRDDSKEWFDSMVRFQTKLLGKGRTPTPDDLKKHKYNYEGYIWDAQQMVYHADIHGLYNEKVYCEIYERYNKDIVEYFISKKSQLLVINLKEENASEKLHKFLGSTKIEIKINHFNKS